MRSLITLIALLIIGIGNVLAAPPKHYLYTSSGELEQLGALLTRPDIEGVQIVYSWKLLENAEGQYNFSAIEEDLARLGKLDKKLFIQIQDRFFTAEARNIPLYLQQEPVYHGGLMAQSDNAGEGMPEGQGWVAMQWQPSVRARFQALLAALAASFDGRIAGMNLPETAIDIDVNDAASGFTCEGYFAATLDNIRFARNAFKQSHVVQYVNFFPCEWNDDQRYMSRLFEFAANNRIGLGGPDIVPYKKAHMNAAYPFLNRYKKRLEQVAMAVQEPTLTYTNPKTGAPFTREELVTFAEDYLGVDIIFWSTQTPWLNPQ
ncbi:hypothetical protein ACCD10_09115 [Pseudomonas sp. Pseusp122]|uniref:hypothetical protein n=1 Tax=unclassified Pseudomonas TaxID=196821 RepID=UPI0039A4FD66